MAGRPKTRAKRLAEQKDNPNEAESNPDIAHAYTRSEKWTDEQLREYIDSERPNIIKALTEQAKDKNDGGSGYAKKVWIEHFNSSGSGNKGDQSIFANWFPYDYQYPFIFHYNEPDEILGFIGGIGSGKSLSGARKAAILTRLNRGYNGLICAPIYKQLRDPVIRLYRQALDADGIPHKYNESRSEISCWNGESIIHLRSFENPDSYRGLEAAWGWGDEIREATKYAVNVFLGRIRQPGAPYRQTFFTTTTNGFDHVYDLFANPDSDIVKKKMSRYWMGNSEQNKSLSRSTIELWKTVYDERFVEQELHAAFINITQGRIYYAFDRLVNVKPCPINWELPIWIGQDFNYNPMCSVIMQPQPNGEVWCVDELHMQSSDVDALCKELKNRKYDPTNKKEDWITVYPDASGVQKQAASGQRSSIKTMELHGFSNIKHPRANARLLDRYASVNGMLRNSKGESKLFFDPRCKYTIRDMERDTYKEGTQLRDDSTEEAKDRGHNADGLGYALHYNFRIEGTWTGYRAF